MRYEVIKDFAGVKKGKNINISEETAKPLLGEYLKKYKQKEEKKTFKTKELK